MRTADRGGGGHNRCNWVLLLFSASAELALDLDLNGPGRVEGVDDAGSATRRRR